MPKACGKSLSGAKFELGRSMTKGERGMDGLPKEKTAPDAPAKPCLLYATCPKYSTKAQIRRVTR